MADYDTVNKEIQDYLSTRLPIESSNREMESLDVRSGDIKYILESLLMTYNDINNNLKNGNISGVNDALLRSDIKMSLVNEQLLKSLKGLADDRDNLLRENQKVEREKADLNSSLFKLKRTLEKIETNKTQHKSAIDELNRIILDQKSKISQLSTNIRDYKEEIKNVKNKIMELEHLRMKSAEQFNSYEKERSQLNGVIQSREESIRKLTEEIRKEGATNSTVKCKLSTLERENDLLKEKSEIKEKNLNMCNGEMSKLITSNRRLSSESEKYKSSSHYYENLYRSINDQNTFLNKQLNKMIRCENFSKEGLKFFEQADDREKKYEAEIEKLKLQNNELGKKNEEYKNKLEDQLYNMNTKDDTIMLKEKVENLVNLNKDYKKKVETLEMEKRTLGDKSTTSTYKQPEVLRYNNDRRNRYYSEGLYNDWHSRNNSLFKNYSTERDTNLFDKVNQRLFTNNEMRDGFNNIRDFSKRTNRPPSSVFNTNLFEKTPGGPLPISPNNQQPQPKLYFNRDSGGLTNKLNLSKNYEENNGKKDILPGGLNNYEDSFKEEDVKIPPSTFMKDGQINSELIKKIVELNTGPSSLSAVAKSEQKKPSNIKAPLNVGTGVVKKVVKKRRKQPPSKTTDSGIDKIFMNPFDVASADDSIKSYQTNSSIKEMLKRTDNLQKKFESLDNALIDIKNSNIPEKDKLENQIKTYNSYYSDLSIDDNDSDIL